MTWWMPWMWRIDWLCVCKGVVQVCVHHGRPVRSSRSCSLLCSLLHPFLFSYFHTDGFTAFLQVMEAPPHWDSGHLLIWIRFSSQQVTINNFPAFVLLYLTSNCIPKTLLSSWPLRMNLALISFSFQKYLLFYRIGIGISPFKTKRYTFQYATNDPM